MTDLLGRAEALQRAAAVASFIQGEVLSIRGACVTVADAVWPLSDEASQAAGEVGGEGLVAVPIVSDLVVLLTQTCNLQKTTAQDVCCQIAPVRTGSAAFARQVARGYHPGWVAMPWHSVVSVADLSYLTTVERSVLVGTASLGRPAMAEEQRHFGEMVSRHFTRFAFPGDVSNALTPLSGPIEKKIRQGLTRGPLRRRGPVDPRRGHA